MRNNKIIKRIADSILSELEHFSQNLKPHRSRQKNVLAYSGSAITGETDGLQGISKVDHTMAQSHAQLQKEPFIAYVKAEVDGSLRTFYICREYTPKHKPKNQTSVYTSYKAPIGQVVEANINDSLYIELPGRNTHIKVIEKDLFKPVYQAQKWDAKSNQFFLSMGTYSIESLLQFIDEYSSIENRERAKISASEIESLEAALQEALERELSVKEGLVREIRAKIALRDQPTLDSTQGTIFRLPLSIQLIITGAPGTGKTTTLIKRIAQKSNSELLTTNEKEAFTDDEIQDLFHNENWVMYTPTELLKIYLKEAFALEAIPASDKRIKIWNEERIKICRDILKFSKIGDKGYFGRTTKNTLNASSNSDLMDLSTKFDEFYCNFIMVRFEQTLYKLKENNTYPSLIEAFQNIIKEVNNLNTSNITQRTYYLIEKLYTCRETFNQINMELDKEIEGCVNTIFESKDGIFKEVYDVMKIHTTDTGASDEQLPEEIEDEEIYEESPTRKPETEDHNLLASRQIKKSVTWYAQQLAIKKNVVKGSLNSDVIDQLSDLLPDDNSLTLIGKKLISRKVANVITRGYSNVLDRIPFYYQKFRQSLLKEKQSYFSSDVDQRIKNNLIDDNEYDLLSYTMLRNAQIILERRKDWINNNSGNALIENIKSQYVTQVTVDEATDFSSLQLGAIFHLANPLTKSVTFSGDLMQRLTQFGITSWDDLKFISNNFKIHDVKTVYRQSDKLLKIASKLYEHFIGEAPSFISAFKENESDPVPLIFSAGNDYTQLAKWISERVIEIYRISNSLPSVAIFVPEENQINEIFNALSPNLMEHSIEVEACYQGKILSTEGKVRIFSVRYIKGLEFESVFLVNLDRLSDDMANLIDKYLYVGLTRAASFLAITYADSFPEKIRFIEDDFLTGDWKKLVP